MTSYDPVSDIERLCEAVDDVISRVETHIRTHHRELAREMKPISQGGWS